MESDICTCTKTNGEHDGTGLNGACLNFALDRKATYWAERRAAKRAAEVKLSEDIKSGRVRPMRSLEAMVTREDAPAAARGEKDARKASLLGQLAAMVGGDDEPQHSGGM